MYVLEACTRVNANPYLILQYWKLRLPEAYAKETSRYCLFQNFENRHTCDLRNLQDFRRKRCHCKSQRSCDLWLAPVFCHMMGSMLVFPRQNWLSDPCVTDLPKLPQSRITDGILDNPYKQKWICHFLCKFSQIVSYSVHLGSHSRLNTPVIKKVVMRIEIRFSAGGVIWIPWRNWWDRHWILSQKILQSWLS